MLVQTVQQMVMLSTSVLNIKWTLKGKPKSPIFKIGGDVVVKVNSIFTLNQISGQVIEHQESWDLSESSPLAQVYFWSSKRLFATVEAGKDVSDFIKDSTNRVEAKNKNVETYPDPTGDPTKVCRQKRSSFITHINDSKTCARSSFFRGTMAFRETSTRLHCFWQ